MIFCILLFPKTRTSLADYTIPLGTILRSFLWQWSHIGCCYQLSWCQITAGYWVIIIYGIVWHWLCPYTVYYNLIHRQQLCYSCRPSLTSQLLKWLTSVLHLLLGQSNPARGIMTGRHAADTKEFMSICMINKQLCNYDHVDNGWSDSWLSGPLQFWIGLSNPGCHDKKTRCAAMCMSDICTGISLYDSHTRNKIQPIRAR